MKLNGTKPAAVILAGPKLPLALTPEAQELKLAALEAAAVVVEVNNAADNKMAVYAQTTLHDFKRSVEKAIEPLIDKANDYKKKVWAARDECLAKVEAELLRVSRLAGDFAALELAKARAAEQAKNEALTKLEQERAAKIAVAGSHEAVDSINEEFAAKAAMTTETPVHEPVRAQGQRISEEWEIHVVDIHVLYRNHPMCVKLTPYLTEIKALLELGHKVAGVKAEKVVKASVRASKQQQPIDI